MSFLGKLLQASLHWGESHDYSPKWVMMTHDLLRVVKKQAKIECRQISLYCLSACSRTHDHPNGPIRNCQILRLAPKTASIFNAMHTHIWRPQLPHSRLFTSPYPQTMTFGKHILRLIHNNMPFRYYFKRNGYEKENRKNPCPHLVPYATVQSTKWGNACQRATNKTWIHSTSSNFVQFYVHSHHNNTAAVNHPHPLPYPHLLSSLSVPNYISYIIFVQFRLFTHDTHTHRHHRSWLPKAH